MDLSKKIVSDGYDRVGRRYLQLIDSMGPGVRDKYLGALTSRLPRGAGVLELGCGAGEPITRRLTADYRVAAVELSWGQIRLARTNAPAARLVRGDMSRLGFVAESFDAVVAFYAITHVPRAEHAGVLAGARRVLRPGGWLLVTMGAGDNPDNVESDWLGAPMFFSHYGSLRNDELVEAAGFRIDIAQDEWETEEWTPVCFHWILAQKAA